MAAAVRRWLALADGNDDVEMVEAAPVATQAA
jgi:hypothetical protein